MTKSKKTTPVPKAGIKLFPDFTSTGLWEADTGRSLSDNVLSKAIRAAVRDWHAQWAKWDIGFREFDPKKEPMSREWLERVGYLEWYNYGKALAKHIEAELRVPVSYEAETFEEVCEIHELT